MYAVVELNVLDNECNILQTFSDYKDSLEYLNSFINQIEEFKDTKYYMKYLDSEDKMSVYKRNWICPKTLCYRYFIQEY